MKTKVKKFLVTIFLSVLRLGRKRASTVKVHKYLPQIYTNRGWDNNAVSELKKLEVIKVSHIKIEKIEITVITNPRYTKLVGIMCNRETKRKNVRRQLL